MENNNYFGSNLKHLRIQNGMTQQEIADKMEKDYSTIGKWETSQRFPVMSDVIKISEIFGVSLSDLIYKNLMETKSNKSFDEFELLFDKHKDILTDEDKEYITFIIEKRKKEIDKQLDGE